MKNSDFNYDLAFSRNFGWVTKENQLQLKNSRVAIAGMGGVGGNHIITLTRLGIEKFHLADFDTFEIHNFNRQAGAMMSTLGQAKLSVMSRLALDINPNLEIKAFSEGVQEQNMDAFLNGVDIFVDGLDVYEIDIRRKVFMECHRRGIPVVTVGPVGMGGALLNFLPGQMSFDDYFGINSQQSLEEKFARFLVGLTPSFIHMKAMADISSINPKERKAPSTPMGCYLAAGIMGSEVLKILLKRGKVYAAPYSLQFDAYSNVLKKKCFWGGAKNPLFQLRLWIFKRLMKARNKK